MIPSEIQTLPVAERLRLMELLWDSLMPETPVGAQVPSWHNDVLAQRAQRLDSGEEVVASWPEAKERIRSRSRRH